MSTYRTWPLPLTPYAPAPAGPTDMAAAPNGTLYYLRSYNVLGRLEYTPPLAGTPGAASNDKLTEWLIPPSLHGAVGGNGSPPNGSPVGLAIRKPSEVWWAMRNGGSLISCDAVANTMTSYRNMYAINGVPAPQWYPFSSVNDLFFRTVDDLWFCGSGFVNPHAPNVNAMGPYIGRFNIPTRKAKLWQIKRVSGQPHFGLLAPFTVWADPEGRYAWCTLANWQYNVFGSEPQPFLWRLEVANGNSTVWYETSPHPSPTLMSGASKIIPDDPVHPKKLWLNRLNGPNEYLLSFDLTAPTTPPSKIFNMYMPSGTPQIGDLAIYKDLWLGTKQAEIQAFSGAPYCAKQMTYEYSLLGVPPDDYVAEVHTIEVPNHHYKAKGTPNTVLPNQNNCFSTLPLPLTTANLLTHAVQANGRPSLAFGDSGGTALGILDP